MKNEVKLLKILLNNYPSWVSSKSIIASLSISIRTLRSLVKEVNRQGSIVLSSDSGYRLSATTLDVVKNRVKTYELETQPESFAFRQKYLMKQLLLKNDGLDFYAIQDSLFISESTLNAELTELRRLLDTYGILLIRRGNTIKLIGPEPKIRKLMSDNIYEEVKSKLLTSSILVKTFPEYDIVSIRQIIKTVLAEKRLTIDDFGITDLILHICIMLDRIQSKQFSPLTESLSIKDIPNYQLSKDLLKQISEIVQFSIPESEIISIAPLVSLNTRQMLDPNITLKDLSSIISPDIIQVVTNIIKKVKDAFEVDLNSELFLVRFSLHLNQIVHYHTKSTRNPLQKNIKDSFPLVFEISVFIADLIHNEYPNIKLDDHDISYIALHIGMAVEKENNSRIKTALIIPEYSALKDNLAQTLIDFYASSLDILGIYHDFNDLPKDNSYALILTLESSYEFECLSKVVQISPFFNNQDIVKIQTAISQILEIRNRHNSISMNQLFDENRFIIYDNKRVEPSLVIHDLCSNLIQTGFVSSDFEQEVHKRESLSPTAYSNIVVPHAMNPCGYKTGIAVAIFKNRIPWKANSINIVLLLVVKPDDKDSFKRVFQQAVEIFTSAEWNEKYKTITSYKDFALLINEIVPKEKQ